MEISARLQGLLPSWMANKQGPEWLHKLLGEWLPQWVSLLQVEAGQIAALHLLGQVGASRPVARRVVQKAPETRLNLTLHGVFVESDPGKGEAIIGQRGSKQKYYQVGDKVMNGVRLQAVFNDHVVLSRNGASEVLRFPKNIKPVAKGSYLSQRSPQVVAAAQSLGSYRDLFQRQPLKIFEHIRFVPVRSGRTLKGYRVLPQRDRKLYNKLGIRPTSSPQ